MRGIRAAADGGDGDRRSGIGGRGGGNNDAVAVRPGHPGHDPHFVVHGDRGGEHVGVGLHRLGNPRRDGAQGIAGHHRVGVIGGVPVGVGDGYRERIARCGGSRNREQPQREHLHTGRVARRRQHGRRGSGKHQNTAAEGLRHEQVGPVEGQRGWSADGIGGGNPRGIDAPGLVSDRVGDEVPLAENYARRHTRRELGDRLVHQNAVVAAVGHEQPLAVREGEARKVQRRLAQVRVGGVPVAVFSVRDLAHRGCLDASGGIRRESVVRNAGDHVLLAQSDIRGRVVPGRNRVPDQHPALAEVANEEALAVRAHGRRIEHVGGAGGRSAFSQISLRLSGEVRLPQLYIGRLPVCCGPTLPDQHAIVHRVGDKEHVSLDPHTLRAAQRLRRRGNCVPGSGVRADGDEIRLAKNQVGGLSVGPGPGVPDQDAVVVGICHNQAVAVGSRVGGSPDAGGRGGDGIACGREVRLSQHQIGGSAAYRAPPVGRIRGCRLRCRRRQLRGPGGAGGVAGAEEIVVEEHAVVLRVDARAEHARVHDHQFAVAVRDAAGSSQ